MFVAHTIEWMREVRRVLRKDGVFWLDLDDSRGAHGSRLPDQKRKNVTTTPGRMPPDIPAKCLCLIPQRVAVAAAEDGWTVRSQIVIPSWMPESAKDRPVDSYRVLLMLTKSKRYWFDMFVVRQIAMSDERMLVARRYIEAANLGEEGGVFDRDLWPSTTNRQPALLPSDGSSRDHRIGIGATPPVFDLPNGEDDLGLPALESKIGEQFLGNGRGSLVADGPDQARQPVMILRPEDIPGATKEFIGEINSLRQGLPDAYQLLVVRADAASVLRGADVGDTDMAIGIDDACKVGKNEATVHTTNSTTGNRPVSTRNLGNIWFVPPSSYPLPHFATMPLAEAERCVLISCPAEVCVRCGKPRVRITKSTSNPRRVEGYTAHGQHRGTLRNDDGIGGPGSGALTPTVETIGWTTCACDPPEYEPGTVLDPFAGTGTTLLAAAKLGRKAIGIELSEEYCRQAVTRLTVGDKGIRVLAAAQREGSEQGVMLLRPAIASAGRSSTDAGRNTRTCAGKTSSGAVISRCRSATGAGARSQHADATPVRLPAVRPSMRTISGGRRLRPHSSGRCTPARTAVASHGRRFTISCRLTA
jgi:hypothetical protein